MMNARISKQAKRIAALLSMVYFASYLMRKNFSVMLAAITAAGFDAVALGAVGSALTVSYGAGQIISGVLGDKIKPRYMLTIGLFLAAICNLLMPFCAQIPLMTVIWFVNGFAHAMLWPPMVRLMATYMNDDEYGYAAVRVSVASSIATIVLYLACPILLKALMWNEVILTVAIAGAAIAVIWVLLSPSVFGEREALPSPSAIPNDEPERKGRSALLGGAAVASVVLIFISIVLQGALRDGVGDWMPSFMADAFSLDPASAIITGIVPAVFGMLSFSVFDLLHRKLLKNEVCCAAVTFAGSAVLSLLLLLVNAFCRGSAFGAVASAVLIGFVVACMHGINLMLITVVPKRFAASGRVSTFSGFFNCATYVGAAIALPLFPALKERFDWSVTIAVWCGISVLGAALCFAALPKWKKFVGK